MSMTFKGDVFVDGTGLRGGAGYRKPGGHYIASYGGMSEKLDRLYHLAHKTGLEAKIGPKPPTKAQVTAINRATRDRLAKAEKRAR